ncbi:hypothetical protein Patl1_27252 [Pistacia atlantica]|uniref:Uncharacterized protein n=1 Tax=Pistacia atlantica TaxID=434234 RepID=A0ACC1BBJ7_9ROSI|nr:hypothetical protein Patl1_27252 [Pistacia atlantica]
MFTGLWRLATLGLHSDRFVTSVGIRGGFVTIDAVGASHDRSTTSVGIRGGFVTIGFGSWQIDDDGDAWLRWGGNAMMVEDGDGWWPCDSVVMMLAD